MKSLVIFILILGVSMSGAAALGNTHPKSSKRCAAQQKDGRKVITVPEAGCSVSLIGKLRKESKLGPPGYGIGGSPQSDERVQIYVLILPKPMVFRESSGVEDTLDAVQAILTRAQVRNATGLFGRKIAVLDVVGWSTAPAEYSDVVIFSSTIRPID